MGIYIKKQEAKFKGVLKEGRVLTLHVFFLFWSVLSNKLVAPMLSSIIAALSQEVVPQGKDKL